jgi:Zn-dependent protease with chaperone function
MPGPLRSLMPMDAPLPEQIEPYRNISSKAYEHPADRAATAALKAIPMLDTVVRRLIEWRYERAMRQFYLGNSIRVSDRQLPELFGAFSHAKRILDLNSVQELYVHRHVFGDGTVIGARQPIVVLDAGLVEKLGPGEQIALVAHELGHVLSDHVVYQTALNIMMSAGAGAIPFLGLPLRAVRAVLLEWYRATELSCDRAATLAVRDPRIVCRLQMVAAAGLPAERLDLDAFLAQALDYESWDDPSDRVRRFFNEIGRTHSNAVRRVSEVMAWVKSGEYDRIVRGEYRKRDDPTDVGQEASDAIEFYAERFRAFFRDAAENLGAVGSQLGDAGQQLADWVRSRTGRPPFGG